MCMCFLTMEAKKWSGMFDACGKASDGVSKFSTANRRNAGICKQISTEGSYFVAQGF